MFHNKLAPKVPNNILRNPPFCSFASFTILLLTYFINKPDSSIDLIISEYLSFLCSKSLMLFSSLTPEDGKLIYVDVKLRYVGAYLIQTFQQTLLANGLSTSPIKSNLVFSNCSKSLPKNPPDCYILCN